MAAYPICIFNILIGLLLHMNAFQKITIVGHWNTDFFFKKFKGWVPCFSMQVVMNKCFFLNPEKTFFADMSCRFEKNKKPTL